MLNVTQDIYKVAFVSAETGTCDMHLLSERDKKRDPGAKVALCLFFIG